MWDLFWAVPSIIREWLQGTFGDLLVAAYRDHLDGALDAFVALIMASNSSVDTLPGSLAFYLAFRVSYWAQPYMLGPMHSFHAWAFWFMYSPMAFWAVLSLALVCTFILIVLIRITVPRFKGESLSKLGWQALLGWAAFVALLYVGVFLLA